MGLSREGCGLHWATACPTWKRSKANGTRLVSARARLADVPRYLGVLLPRSVLLHGGPLGDREWFYARRIRLKKPGVFEVSSGLAVGCCSERKLHTNLAPTVAKCRPPPPPPPRRSRSTSSSAPSPTRGPPTAPRSARRAPPTRRAAGAAAAPRRRTRASRTRSASRRATATSSRSRAGPRRASAWTTRCCPSRTSAAPRRGRPTRAGSGSTTRPAARTSCGAPC